LEVDVLMNGNHDIDRCAETTERVLRELYAHLTAAGAPLQETLLMSNMITPGTSGPKVSREEVAERTTRVLRRVVPPAVPGIAFISGEQVDAATVHLNLMNQEPGLPWVLTFAFGRALHGWAKGAWAGDARKLAERKFAERAEENSKAAIGQLVIRQGGDTATHRR
jgi:fructose-bisphosphate aldolase class I